MSAETDRSDNPQQRNRTTTRHSPLTAIAEPVFVIARSVTRTNAGMRMSASIAIGQGRSTMTSDEIVNRKAADGSEPGPKQREFYALLATFTKPKKRAPVLQLSDRRRLARTARKELADLPMGGKT